MRHQTHRFQRGENIGDQQASVITAKDIRAAVTRVYLASEKWLQRGMENCGKGFSEGWKNVDICSRAKAGAILSFSLARGSVARAGVEICGSLCGDL